MPESTSDTTASQSKSAYNPLAQFNISAIKLYRDGWADNEKYDIRDMMFEFNIYEDIFDGSMSACIVLADYANVVDNFPIVGGERIDIFYKTPIDDYEQKLSFAVAKVGARHIELDGSEFSVEELHLVTPERLVESDYALSNHYEGTYKDIIQQLIEHGGSEKNVKADETLYVQSFIAPLWPPLKCCEHIAKRAIGPKFEPFLFFETVDGYNFRSVKELTSQKAFARYKIEPGRVFSDREDFDRKFRRVLKYEILESGNRMRQRDEMGFGGTIYFIDPINVRYNLDSRFYDEMVKSEGYAKVDKYPLYSGWHGIKTGVELAREDKSHEGAFYRKFYMALMDNFRIKVLVPGDSSLRAGMVIELDVPDKSVSRYQKEQMTSGRWLIASLKHLIKREAYSTVLELVKDSHEVDIIKKANDGELVYDETRIPTGNAAPAQPEDVEDSN